MEKTGYILGISRGHNSSICLLKDGEIVFSIEEERLSRQKYDGSAFAAIYKVLDYTDKVDYIVIASTMPLKEKWQVPGTVGLIDFTGDDIYTGLARKLGLIDRKQNIYEYYNHPQIIDLSKLHHKMHASIAFYNSGFENAISVVVDGAGSTYEDLDLYEIESVYACSYDKGIRALFKHFSSNQLTEGGCGFSTILSPEIEDAGPFDCLFSDHAGIVKSYEAITEYCGFDPIEAGKTMGLFPYGKENKNLPDLFLKNMRFPITDRNTIAPKYPATAIFNSSMYYTFDGMVPNDVDPSTLQNRRDAAYWVQTETQQAVLDFIISAVEKSGNKNVVLSGGYGLNCVANYFYLEKLNELGINLYVEPISNDGGTAIGAALYWYYLTTGDTKPRKRNESLYLGPKYNYSEDYINSLGEVIDCTKEDIVALLREKKIVTIFQGRSENGPRALGNRSVLFDPTFEDGKDFVNAVKRREYFRPFAGTILQEHVHEWFDLRGMNDSPHMMYAVNCKDGVVEKIPSIIHVDGTCRIQTVTREQNENYYDLIEAFYKETGIPILFNTSFNLGGEPLVETLEDALWTLKNSDIEYLYLPEYGKLITVKN